MDFSHQDIEILERESRLASYLKVDRFKLRFRLFKGGWSHSIQREVLMRAPAAVVLLYHRVSDQVVMVEQFRMGVLESDFGPWLLEPVAGLIDSGETPEAAAHREAFEEAGCQITQLIPVATYIVSPGISTELTTTYCGLIDELPKDLSLHGVQEDGEDIRLHCLSAEAAIGLLNSNHLLSASGTILLQWFRWHHKTLKRS